MVHVSEGGRSSSDVVAIVSRKAKMRHSYKSCTCKDWVSKACVRIVYYNVYLLVENLELLQSCRDFLKEGLNVK